MGTYTAQPTPIGTSSNTGVYSPQPAPAPSAQPSNNDWNTQWNQVYNQAWNAGYNSGSKPQVDSSFSSAVDQGYSAGQSKYNSTKTANPANSFTVNNPTPNTPTGPSAQDIINQERDKVYAEINGGYDAYLNQLGYSLENDLPTQASNQNQIVQNNYTSGLQNLDLQKQSGEFDLNAEAERNNANQVKTLKDVSNNVRNLIFATNNKIGAMGGADSSASKMASYAITKLGSQQYGDVKAQSRTIDADIQARKWKLTNAYQQEVIKLKNEVSNKTLEINNWFNEQQNNLRLMIAQGKLNKGVELANLSKQILQESINRLSTFQQEQANKEATLRTWVLNQSTSIGEAIAKWNEISASRNQQVTTNPINANMTMSGSNTQTPRYGGYSAYNDEDSLF